MTAKRCFRVKVETTNALGTTFRMHGDYHACIDGVVYVAATCIADAAQQVPVAVSMEDVGVFMPAPATQSATPEEM